jgi:hypothetical protein
MKKHIRKRLSTLGGPLALLAGLTIAPNIGHAQEGTKFLTLQNVSSATVAPHGTVFGSLTGTTRRRGIGQGDDVDGSIELGFGLGSAEEAVGLQFSSTITSLTNDFGDSGYLNLKLSRRILSGAHPTYIGLEASHFGNWGDARRNKLRGKITVTTFGRTPVSAAGDSYPYMLSLGIGNDLRNNATDPGVFFGAGIGVTESLGLSAAWTGETFDIGASLRSASLKNVSFNASVNDVFDMEKDRRLTVSVSWYTTGVFGGMGQ